MDKKKVGIVTIVDFDNYGNRLQNYAVSYFTNKYFKSETLCIVEDNFRNRYNKFCYNFLWLEKIKIAFRKITGKDNIKKQRYYNFLLFSKNNIPLRYCFKKNGVLESELDKKYNYFVIGSDQVWNPLFGCGTEIEYLRFARKEQKICFSPSFGISELPDEEKEFVKESLLSFDKISVREEEGKRLIYDVSGKKAEVLIDPTMMLTPEEWLSVSKEVNIKNSSPYILVYFLGDRDRNRDKVVSTIAKKYSLDEYRLVDLSNHELYKAGPAEFIKLICNAKLVCTDSFHAIVFSIIFKIPFIVFGRAGGTGMNSRINTLLRKFKLEDRVNENFDINKVFEIDYSNVDDILKGERKKVMEYFKEYITI